MQEVTAIYFLLSFTHKLADTLQFSFDNTLLFLGFTLSSFACSHAANNSYKYPLISSFLSPTPPPEKDSSSPSLPPLSHQPGRLLLSLHISYLPCCSFNMTPFVPHISLLISFARRRSSPRRIAAASSTRCPRSDVITTGYR
jgi:hypothetical protein